MHGTVAASRSLCSEALKACWLSVAQLQGCRSEQWTMGTVLWAQYGTT
jgi:hypothetical protein